MDFWTMLAIAVVLAALGITWAVNAPEPEIDKTAASQVAARVRRGGRGEDAGSLRTGDASKTSPIGTTAQAGRGFDSLAAHGEATPPSA